MDPFNPSSSFGGAGGGSDNSIPVAFACWGDSLTAFSTPGYCRYFRDSFTVVPVLVYDGGAGGESITQIAARMVAKPAFFERIMIVWDRINGGDDNANYVAQIATMVAACTSGKFIIISDINATSGSEDVGSGYRTLMDERNATLSATYGANFLDVVDVLDDAGTRSDGVHLTADANQNILIPAIKQKLVDLGYMTVTS